MRFATRAKIARDKSPQTLPTITIAESGHGEAKFEVLLKDDAVSSKVGQVSSAELLAKEGAEKKGKDDAVAVAKLTEKEDKAENADVGAVVGEAVAAVVDAAVANGVGKGVGNGVGAEEGKGVGKGVGVGDGVGADVEYCSQQTKFAAPGNAQQGGFMLPGSFQTSTLSQNKILSFPLE